MDNERRNNERVVAIRHREGAWSSVKREAFSLRGIAVAIFLDVTALGIFLMFSGAYYFWEGRNFIKVPAPTMVVKQGKP